MVGLVGFSKVLVGLLRRLEGRNFMFGTEVSSLHASSSFVTHYPVRYGNLNVTDTYTGVQCCEDLERILTTSIKD